VFRELLKRSSALPDESLAALEAHYELMLRWNKVLNLTRVERVEDAVDRHYVESLFVASHLPEGAWRIADIGSGAGFPGIPVAVSRPDCQVTLIESHQRKAVFLREATRKLANVKVVASRAEQVKERFDWVISRAVSFQDLKSSLRSLAPRAALLIGAELPPRELGFEWEPAVPLPSGNSRFLIVSRETVVSRETPQL
jgi:16S rRNA (guanine527-N7)-methyltransferase